MQLKKTIDKESAAMMAVDSKIGVLATEDDRGYPHLTFLSSLQGYGEKQLTFGMFCYGLSKQHLLTRKSAGFLVLDASKRFLSGLATFTHTENTGDVFDAYNQKPLFRYNTYCGFSKVYFMDLVGITAMQQLPMPAVVAGAILSRMKAPFQRRNALHAIPPIGQALLSRLDSLKFLCFFDADGYPIVFPIVQATAAGADRVVCTKFPYRELFSAIPDGCKAAILCVTLDMESILVKGIYHSGALDVEYVYNSMPPKMEYVYPRAKETPPITAFTAQ